MKIRIFLLLVLIPLFTHSQGAPPSTISTRIPNIELNNVDFMYQLEGTVWMTVNIKEKSDYYVFFHNGKQARAKVAQGQAVTLPTLYFPMKYIQAGVEPNSAIILITTQERILYYSIRLITPYYLGISAGFNTIEPLLKYKLSDYFKDGVLLQIVY